MKDKKGFTLVELLAVIVILAIIMIIAIPAVLDTVNSARKKTFVEYITKVTNEAAKKSLSDSLLGNSSNVCTIYNIKKDLGLASTGNFDGYVMINKDNKYLVSIHDDNYKVENIKFDDNIEDYIKSFDSSDNTINVSKICNSSSCDKCVVSKEEAIAAGVTPIDTDEESPDSTSADQKVIIESKSILKTFNVKDYVKYYPSATSYNVDTNLTGAPSDGTINPSKLTTWRVFKKTNSYIELIPVGASDKTIRLSGLTGYANFIYVLNRASEAYINKDYSVSARSFGYNGKSTEMITDYSVLNNITSRPCPSTYSSSNEPLGCGDNEGRWNNDYIILKDTFLTERSSSNLYPAGMPGSWLAIRGFNSAKPTDWSFVPFSLDGSYAANGTWIYQYVLGNESPSINAYSFKLIPIIRLKNDISITGGDGSKESPYTLGK